jgi:flagellin
MIINTNTGALRAQNGSRLANQALETAMERLSSGKRINSSKDDAAGLAIASKMTGQIRGMNQAVRNANDGISFAQTAEGALSEVTNMLQRVRELAVQSASGTYSAADRTNLNAEVIELKAQITNVLATTDFNGTRIFNSAATGSAYTAAAGNVAIQTGSNANDTVCDHVRRCSATLPPPPRSTPSPTPPRRSPTSTRHWPTLPPPGRSSAPR